jgi:hypothetical protein
MSVKVGVESPILSNRNDIQIVDRGIVPKIRCHQRNAPLQRRRCDPGVRRLDRLPSAPSAIHHLGPDRTGALIGVERRVQGHML